jgi:hypothetical protein
MAMREPSTKEKLIQDILNMSDDQAKEVQALIDTFKKLQIPIDDELLSDEERQALKEFDAGKMKFVNFDSVRREGDE